MECWTPWPDILRGDIQADCADRIIVMGDEAKLRQVISEPSQ